MDSFGIHWEKRQKCVTINWCARKGERYDIITVKICDSARQVLEQADLLEGHYKGEEARKRVFCVSTQHYSFAVNAFVDLIKEYGQQKYDFSLRETQTYEIIEDVAQMRSEIGILHLSAFNEVILRKELKKHQLSFQELLVARPHVFVSRSHPLAGQKSVSFRELEPYPYLSFEQGEHNSFYYSEEIFSEEEKKNIRVRDRATLFNLLIKACWRKAICQP